MSPSLALPNVHIRWMIRRDVPAILQMEQQSYPDPWEEATLLHHLRKIKVICLVAERGEDVIGYAIYGLYKKRLHLLRFTVESQSRRKSVGALMMKKLQTKLDPGQRSHLTVTLRETNLGGLLFLRRLGFRATGMQRSYYADTDEDAIFLEFRQEVLPTTALLAEQQNSSY